MEMMVALAILGLVAGSTFSSVGPWLAEARRGGDQALFWRSVPAAQLVLSELAAGAVDDGEEAASIGAQATRFRTYTPRLAPAPFDAELSIEPEAAGARLVLRAPMLAAPSVLLTAPTPLRFTDSESAIVLETRMGQAWTPIAVARFETNAPIVCAFDTISRTCR